MRIDRWIVHDQSIVFSWVRSESCSTVECINYTYSIWKSISVFDVCITFRSSIISFQRFFTGSHIIINAKLMDYLRFGKFQAGFVCLLFSPWRHITEALLNMDQLLTMTSPHSWPTRLGTPYFVYFSRTTQLSRRSFVPCFQKDLRYMGRYPERTYFFLGDSWSYCPSWPSKPLSFT